MPLEEHGLKFLGGQFIGKLLGVVDDGLSIMHSALSILESYKTFSRHSI